MITVSRKLKFWTVEKLKNRRIDGVMKAIRSTVSVYKKRGFQVCVVQADNEFDPLRAELAADLEIDLNCAAADMHVPEVEREIRTIKERGRCVYATLPFKKIPAMMVDALVVHAVKWLNSFPATDSVIGEMSPRELMTGVPVDFAKHCKLEFGEYVPTHEEHDNSMTSRTIGAIALTATMNEQGGYYFMNLSSGLRIHRKQWTQLPMPDDVIERVHEIAGDAGQGHDPVGLDPR